MRICTAALLTTLLMSSLATAADGAGAAPRKFYVGLEAGQARSDINLIDLFISPTNPHYEGKSTGVKLRFGYQFIRYVAVEGGYANFGEFTLDDVPYFCSSNPGGTCTYRVRSGSQGAFVNAVGSLPFAERFALNGRLGYSYLWGRTRQSDPAVAGSTSTIKRKSFGAIYGLGLSCELTPALEAELAWGRFDQIGVALSLGGDAVFFDLGSAKLLSLGLRHRF